MQLLPAIEDILPRMILVDERILSISGAMRLRDTLMTETEWDLPEHTPQGLCAKTGDLVNVLNTLTDERFQGHNNRQAIKLEALSVLCVPVVESEGRVLGVISCINKVQFSGKKSGLPFRGRDVINGRDVAKAVADLCVRHQRAVRLHTLWTASPATSGKRAANKHALPDGSASEQFPEREETRNPLLSVVDTKIARQHAIVLQKYWQGKLLMNDYKKACQKGLGPRQALVDAANTRYARLAQTSIADGFHWLKVKPTKGKDVGKHSTAAKGRLKVSMIRENRAETSTSTRAEHDYAV